MAPAVCQIRAVKIPQDTHRGLHPHQLSPHTVKYYSLVSLLVQFLSHYCAIRQINLMSAYKRSCKRSGSRDWGNHYDDGFNEFIAVFWYSDICRDHHGISKTFNWLMWTEDHIASALLQLSYNVAHPRRIVIWNIPLSPAPSEQTPAGEGWNHAIFIRAIPSWGAIAVKVKYCIHLRKMQQ